MRRSLFGFVVGLITGIALMLVVDGPSYFGLLGDNAGEAIEGASRSARQLQLETRVRTALALQKDFDLIGGISVEAEDDEVTLSGTVATIEQLQLAELIAKGVDGVGSIVNELEVRGDDIEE
jgi:hypothetical protein